MSERTFRAVVASVLVGSLALAALVSIAILSPPRPSPSPRSTATTNPTPVPTVTQTPIPGPAFEAPKVVNVGLVSRGSRSEPTLVLEFIELNADAIPDAPGSFRVSLADHDGNETTVAFTGAPSVDAPGSLGATATLTGPNRLLIEIVASDEANVERITIGGLGISATENAAVGPIVAEASEFTGSLAAASDIDILPSPGSVVGPS